MFNQLMRDCLSFEGDDTLKVSSEGKHEDDISIDLSDFEDDYVSLGAIATVVRSKSLRMKYSMEGSINLSKNTFDPNNVHLLDKTDQTDGSTNLVTNGEYLPDVIAQSRSDSHIKIVTPRTALIRLERDVIYYVIDDDDNNHVYKHLKSEGVYVANDPTMLAEVLEVYRHDHRK